MIRALLVYCLLPLSLAVCQEPADNSENTEKEKEPLPEISVVAYDSQTHGAIEVQSMLDDPSDWFQVVQGEKSAISGVPPLLNNTVKVLPGEYEVIVNDTRRTVTVAAGEKTVLLTGELVVEGEHKSAFWFPAHDDDEKLAGVQPLFNKSRPLFAGTYRVYAVIHSSDGAIDLGSAEVKPGEKTVVKH